MNINAALLHLLLAGGQGSIPSIGGMDLNQPIQNLLAPNLLNMSAAHLSNGNGLHGGGGAGMSGADFAVPPSRSSQKMNNSSSKKKEEGSRKEWITRHQYSCLRSTLPRLRNASASWLTNL